jgi:hypothetical protein
MLRVKRISADSSLFSKENFRAEMSNQMSIRSRVWLEKTVLGILF